MNKQTCPICGKEFETDYPHKKYCSHECRLERNKQRSRERRINNREAENERYRRYVKENPDKVRETRRKYYQKNKNRLKQLHHEYYLKNRESILNQRKISRCRKKHDECSNCPTDGDCLFD